ncbi:hypothetical protein L6452_30265 [Arctium lappa]|uniref:Uncharacterized protein n=1 Tax=Arctium lappa TaxID=4217 RepID=A0ACB8ZI38_ARCLA|nr:hypothetical protein L6452_30265 [Arctium lappa]
MSSELPPPPPPHNRFKTLSKFKRTIRERTTNGTGSKSSSTNRISTKGDGGEIKGDEERAKLVERFYEIYAERSNTILKATNTWEPIENLSSCPDVIGAFEKRFSVR